MSDDSNHSNITSSGKYGKSSRYVNRRRVLSALGATGIAALAGCSGSGPSDGGEADTTTESSDSDGNNNSGNQNTTTSTASSADITLDYWTLFAGGDGKTMTEMVKSFNEEHDNIHIKKQRLPWAQYYNKLYTSMTGGNPPDLAIMHLSRMRRFGPVMEPIGDVVNADPYVSKAVNQATIKGKFRSAPLDLHPVATYYNKDVFEKAGLDPEKSVMGSWKQFKEACNTIVKETDATAWDAGTGSHGLRVRQPWLRQMGSRFLKKKGGSWKMAFNDDNGLKVAKTIDKEITKWNWHAKGGSAAWEDFTNNKHAMLNDGTWAYSRYKGSDFNWGLMKAPPAPGMGSKGNLTWTNSHSIGIPRNNSRSKEKLKAAKKAARYLTQDVAIKWGKSAGHIPAYSQARHSSELKKAPVWDKTLSLFVDMVENDEVVYMPQTTKNAQYKNAIYTNLDAVRTQTMDPKPALDKIENSINSLF